MEINWRDGVWNRAMKMYVFVPGDQMDGGRTT